MKKNVMEFLNRGLKVSGFGPVVLAIIYFLLKQHGVVQTLTVNEVCIGIISLFILAFIAGGMSSIYREEKLPLMAAILIHGTVLYIGYLATYLVNGWLVFSVAPMLIFTAIFVLGYFVIWIIIYSAIRKNTKKLNETLKEKQNLR